MAVIFSLFCLVKSSKLFILQMKRKHVEGRNECMVKGDDGKETNGNNGFYTDRQSTYSSNHDQKEENSAGDLKDAVGEREANVPVVVRGALTKWPSLAWGEEGWLQVLGDKEIEVRFGERDPRYLHPAWERCTKVRKVPASKLLLANQRAELVGENSWAYWDYKYLAQILPAEHLEAFPWADLGFPSRAGEESTLWIGTKGANTPCHQDSYGTNLVAQLVGRKTWTLFPPSDAAFLQASRLPYEESSVYSLVNFENLAKNSKSTLDDLSQATPYIVTLLPGEVLFVPRHWWHFVYNEEFSISVNTWLPHPLDSKARLEEALVRVQAATFARQLPAELSSILLNPNEADLVEEDMLGLYKLCQQMATQIVDEQDNANTPLKPIFGEDYSLLCPSPLTIPKKIVREGEICDEYQDCRLKAYQALTASQAISAAADVYLENMIHKCNFQT